MSDNAEGGLFGRVRGNAEWEGIKWVWAAVRSGVVTAAYGLFQKARHIQVDWIGLGILFALSFVAGLLLILIRKLKLKKSAIDPPTNGLATDSGVAKLFSPLQIDTFQLAKDLQEFVDSMGPPASGNPELNDGSDHGFARYVLDDVRRGSAWRSKFNAGYVAKFSQRVKYLRHEVAKCGVVAWPVIPDEAQSIYPNNVIALPPIIAQSGIELKYPRPKSQVVPSLFSPLQTEIIQLSRDLRQFLKDSGPRPTLQQDLPGENLIAWVKHREAEAIRLADADAKWSTKFRYAYRESFAGRVKTLMHSIRKTTGMVVDEFEPYSTDVTPGADFQQLLDLLMDFFDKIENPDRLKESVESLSPQPEEQREPSPSILQSEAFTLSDDLREFLKKLGPRPHVKPDSEFEHSVDGTADWKRTE
jgi:hypothetical protein